MDAVGDAFEATPRARFLPKLARRRASFDGPIQIGHGQTNSQPRTVADMLRLLQVQPGNRVLDVGSGSGWTTGLLAYLTGQSGSVLGLEIEPELVLFGRGNLKGVQRPWARIEHADPEVLGRPEEAPYDRILVSADARTLPGELVDQLDLGGRLVVPVRGRMTLVVNEVGGFVISEHGDYRFVPLR